MPVIIYNLQIFLFLSLKKECNKFLAILYNLVLFLIVITPYFYCNYVIFIFLLIIKFQQDINRYFTSSA